MGPFAVILPAAGRSTRFGDPRQKKIYSELDGRAVWLRAVEPFVNRADVAQILLAIAPEDRELFERRYRHNVAFLNIQVLDGGAERADTVARALQAVDPSCAFVAVHDAARPCVTSQLIDAVFEAARQHGAAVPGLGVTDTLKRVDDQGRTIETLPRAGVVAVQTPQAFRRDLLERAYAARDRITEPITDDAQLVEGLGHACRVVPGSPFNLKITIPDDLALASAILQVQNRKSPPRAAHPFADERAMWGGPGPGD
jgi:2-C-methyl-D-erythritol 4-phosphate cytidylyltransferase